MFLCRSTHFLRTTCFSTRNCVECCAMRRYRTTNAYDPPSNSQPKCGPKLYDTHIPTAQAQKVSLFLTSSFSAFLDPSRADAVAAVGDVSSSYQLRSLHEMMCSTESGQRVLRERPVLHDQRFDLEALRGLAPNTFGHAYAKFMQNHHFDPSSRPNVRYVDDPDYAYVMLRYRESHDFYHVLTGLPPSVEGEMALKLIEWGWSGLPVAGLSGVFGGVREVGEEGRRFER